MTRLGKTDWGSVVFDASMALGATVLVVGMVEQGYLPDWLAFSMMIFFVVYMGLKNLGVARLVTHILRALFFVILAIVALVNGGVADALFILTRVFWSGLTTVLLEVVKLTIRSYLGLFLAIVFVLALVFLRKAGYGLASMLVYNVFKIAAPVLGFLVLVVTASRGDLRTAVILGSTVLALTAMLLVLAWMAGAFKKGDTG